MFGDKLTAANAKITSLVALLASTGFAINAAAILDPKTEASEIPGVDSLKAHLAAQNKSAIAAATDPLNAQIATFAAGALELAAFKQGIADAGLKVGDFITADKAEGKTPEDKAKAAASANAATVKTAIETAVAGKSAKQIAATGHPHALDVPPGGGEAPKAADVPASKADFHATLDTLKGAERTAYFRKHKAKFGL